MVWYETGWWYGMRLVGDMVYGWERLVGDMVYG